MPQRLYYMIEANPKAVWQSKKSDHMLRIQNSERRPEKVQSRDADDKNGEMT